MISRSAYTYFKAFTLLFLGGLVFGNVNYILFGVFFLAFFLLGANIGEPKDVVVKRTFTPRRPYVGTDLEVRLQVTVSKGSGFVEVFDQVPEIFELVGGNNVHLVWKTLGKEVKQEFTYTLRCTRRGNYEFKPTQVTRINALRLTKAVPEPAGEPVELTVLHKPSGLRRMKEVRGLARTMRTDIDQARIGSQSTEFDELREYTRGDPMKWINWKATARVSTIGRFKPMVNRYEPEGKKAVFFFLDAAHYMQAGSTIENTFENTIKATTGMAKFFIDKGFKLGGQFFNARNDVSIYPDLGERQFLRLTQELSDLEPGDPQVGAFAEAVEAAKVHLISQRPLSIIITRPEINFEETLDGLSRIRRYTSTTRRMRPIIVINPLVYSTVAGSDEYAAFAMNILKAENRTRYHQLRRMGMSVIDWDPKKEDIGVRLLRQVRAR
jgi:uncharacterized protein (DUF58 family)